MHRDIRATKPYREILDLCSKARQPGAGRSSDGSQLRASPDGRHVVFTATLVERIEEEPPTHIALTELATGATRLLTAGPESQRLPEFSPEGRRIAFVSRRAGAPGFQLHVLDVTSGAARAAPQVEGSVEYLQWSADGTRILLGVVGRRDLVIPGPETPGRVVPGLMPPSPVIPARPAWLPRVEPTHAPEDWRSCWIYELATDSVRPAAIDCNIWGAAWCGNSALAALTSNRAGENFWYSATLCVLDLVTGRRREIYLPRDQLAPPVVSASGQHIAIVTGLCSDRGPVMGDLSLVDVHTGERRDIDTRGVDILTVEWQGEQHLLFSGYRGFETVVGLYDVASDAFRQIWSSEDVAITGGCVTALPEPGDCALMVESFTQAPQITVIRGGRQHQAASLDTGYSEAMSHRIAAVERLTWASTDGLEIQGWLLLPRGRPPFPAVMNVHGGPIGHWRPAFLMRKLHHVPILLEQGYAVFLPNPRGSTGRGQAFANEVMGDPGGADAADLLSGLDTLITRGIVDPGRVGITGVSYGGFMAAWLITQSARFAAAVAVSPFTNQVTAQLLSNIPQFMARLVAGRLDDPHGTYFARSPVLYADKPLAPTLNICGALDRCTPPEEAIQFHNALVEAGTRSVLVTYPQEGHGIRGLPAALDCAARLVAWFTEHIPPRQ